VLEQGTMDILTNAGVGERMRSQGALHHGIELAFGGKRHRIDLSELTGKAITVYPQHEVIKDLVAARLAADGQILFEVSNVALHGVERERRRSRLSIAARPVRIEADFVVGATAITASRGRRCRSRTTQEFPAYISLRLVRHPGGIGAVVG
jgi:p-hydroxybenzoate 3-monooxygenase